AVGSAILAAENPIETFMELQKLAADVEAPPPGTHVESIVPVHESHFIKSAAFFGGAAVLPNEQPYKDAYETAKLLAENGIRIINGGGPGIMRAATEGAHAADKHVLAVTYLPSYRHKNYEGSDIDNKFDDEVMTKDYFDRTK